MSRSASKVYTAQSDIERLQRLVVELPSQARVTITTEDGKIVSGTVTERPVVQQFDGPVGSHGVNGQVRLDEPDAPHWQAYIWLGDIRCVHRLLENHY